MSERQMPFASTRALAVLAVLLAVVALALSVITFVRGSGGGTEAPIVLRGMGVLHCSISSTANGSQQLTLVDGSGPKLSVELAPIKDGRVSFGADGSAEYEFSSSLVKPTDLTIAGIGSGTLEKLTVEVKISVTSFEQPGGKGTAFTFRGDALASQSQYLEILGVFRSGEGQRYSLRVSLQDITDGSGSVVPSSADAQSALLSKEVTLGSEAAPATIITTLLELH